MPDADPDALDERLRAVERALTDDDRDLTGLRDAAEVTREVETLAERLDATERRLDELDAATQALRGYVGDVRAVNETVERRADAALAKAESLEADRADGLEGARTGDSANRPSEPPKTCGCERRCPDRAGSHPGRRDDRGSLPRESSEADRTGAWFARVGRLLGLR